MQSTRAALLGALALFVSCTDAPPIVTLGGDTMGTYWQVKLAGKSLDKGRTQSLDAAIREELATVNREMSTYIPHSALSRFNASKSTEWFEVPDAVATLVEQSKTLGQESDGRFDVTVGPLVDLWGFGKKGNRKSPPTEAEIEAARARTGLTKLSVRRSPPALRKQVAGLEVDLSAIAKGHGVDRVAALLERRGHRHFWVDIGGEILARGRKTSKLPWRVGIERPRSDGSRSVLTALPLVDQAVASSGDYRNFFEDGGTRYSHLIDPEVGRPVPRDVAQVSVWAKDCATADAWATALLVLGADAGYAKALALELPALMLVRAEAGGFRELRTPAFERLFSRSVEDR